jgi:NAD(P)H-hydrate epimerase
MPEQNIMKIADITEDMVWSRIPERIQDSHKGTYGKVLCVAGSSRFRGAASLCVEGALRSGCGIVTLATVEPVFASVQARLPEAVLMPCRQSSGQYGGINHTEASRLKNELSEDYSALVIGPGMGNSTDTAFLTDSLVKDSKVISVLDADALNSIRKLPKPSEEGQIIITPHPGEMARLCGCSIKDIKDSREEIAVLYAIINKCIVVLKEHRTLIATPQGRLYRNTSGNSGLARGGSGDILAGMIGSLAAQGMTAEDAAVCGVWLHGRAAELCSQRKSQTVMLPHDIFDDLGQMMKEHDR